MYGPPDEKDKSWELIDGVSTEGYYKLAAGEKLGHYHIEDAREQVLKEKALLDDGECVLYEGQVEDKRKFHLDNLRQSTKATQAAYKDMGHFDDILKMVLNNAARAAGDGDDDERSDGSQDPPSEIEDSDADLRVDDDVDCLGASAIADMFAGPPRKAMGKAKARASTAAGSAPVVATNSSVKGLSAGSPRRPLVHHPARGAKSKLAVPVRQSSTPLNRMEEKKRGRPAKVVDLTDKCAEIRDALKAELDSLQVKIDALQQFTETHDLSIPNELKMFKASQQQRIRDVADVVKVVKKTMNAAAKHSDKFDMQPIHDRCDAILKSLDYAAELSRLMLKDTVDGDSLDKTVRFFEAQGVQVSFPYSVKHFKSLMRVSSTFQNYAQAVELCTLEHSGPLACLDKVWDKDEIEELVMSQLESCFVEQHHHARCQQGWSFQDSLGLLRRCSH